MEAKHEARVKQRSSSENATRWDVQWKNKNYIATTYPKSDHVFIETTSGRAIPAGASTCLKPAIRAAIAKATGEQA